MKIQIHICIFALVIGLKSTAWGQGNTINCGQNRLQIATGNFKRMVQGKIELNYMDSIAYLPNKTLEIANEELLELEQLLNYKIGQSISINLFNNIYQLQHSYSGFEDPYYNNNSIYILPSNVLSVYYNGDFEFLRIELRKAICELILNEMFYGVSISEKIQHLKIQEIPEWFIKGLPEFIGEDWNSEKENFLREFIINKQLENTNTLNLAQNKLLGHALWRYIILKNGTQSIGTLLFIARYSGKINTALKFVCQQNNNQLIRNWKNQYLQNLSKENNSTLPKGQANISNKIAKKSNTEFKLSPNGRNALIKTYDLGKYEIWLFDFASQRNKKIVLGGVKVLNQIANPEMPKIEWLDNSTFAIVVHSKNGFTMLKYDMDGNIISKSTIPLLYIQDIAFTSSGTAFIAGGKDTSNNLYFLEANKLSTILSNSSIKIEELLICGDSVYSLEQNRSSSLIRLIWPQEIQKIVWQNPEPNTKIKSLIAYKTGEIGFLWNRTGVFNAYKTNLNNSAMALTNYGSGIIDQQSKNDILAEMIYYKGKYAIYTSEMEWDATEVITNNRLWKKESEKIDSLMRFKNRRYVQMLDTKNSSDSNITYSKELFYLHGFDTAFNPLNSNILKFNKPNSLSQTLPFVNRLNYKYIDLGINNSALQNYWYTYPYFPYNQTRPDVLFVSANTVLADLYNTLVVEGGMRFNTLFTNTDYWLKAQKNNEKLSHAIAFYRRSRKYELYKNQITQNISTSAIYTAKYALDPRLRTELDLGLRNEIVFTKLTEALVKNFPVTNKLYTIIKPSMVYDNTAIKYLGLNAGMKMKASLNTILGKNIWMQQLEMQWVNYFWLNKKIQMAQRVSAAYNIGKQKTLYMVGGMENLFSNYIQEQTITVQNPSAFDFFASTGNMHGFGFGARYGSSFVVLNNEFRFPLYLWLFKNYYGGHFMRNLQLIACYDIGTAFMGTKPNSTGNPYNTVYLTNPNYLLSVTSKRNPYLHGLGIALKAKVLGYELRYDYSIGNRENSWLKPVNTLTLNNSF